MKRLIIGGLAALGISLVVAALGRNGFHLDEKSVQNHIWFSLPGVLTRQAITEGALAEFFPYPNKSRGMWKTTIR